MYQVIYTDGYTVDTDTLEKAQQIAEKSILLAAAGEDSTFYELVTIVEIGGGGERMLCPLEFDPIIQPNEPPCLHGDNHDWEHDGNERDNGKGITWSRTCLNCAMIEHHDTWHDDGYGGVLHDWIAYGYGK